MDDMAEHYFTETPESAHKPLRFRADYRGHVLSFQTDSGVFSRTEIDKGSAALLAMLPDNISGNVLDMGCGYGAIGICLKKRSPGCRLTMADINERAAALARANAEINGVDAEVLQGDGFSAVANRKFDWIVCNPPIRAGKQAVYGLFDGAADALKPRGVFLLVIRKRQGAPSALVHLRELFDTVDILSRKSGFWVIRCEGSRKMTDGEA
ncbi:MAG: methyltransferase [Clostridiales bacterium]|nr:methyltransferase [Clostridiales bacterium]